jgi:beta-lactam-binding protein with PASTA domain
VTTTTTTTARAADTPHCRVPLLTGRVLVTARTRASARDCRLEVTYAYSAKVPKGRVIRQSPAADAALAAHGEVHVVISRGPHPKRH